MNYLVLAFVVNATQSAGSFDHSLSFPRGNCGESKFKCADGACIDDVELCNGVRDCPDGSDETVNTCQNFYCPPYAFRCNYGACVQGSYECNGYSNCVDNSDELSLNCRGVTKNSVSGNCGYDMFQCSSGQCVSYYEVCNGRKNCTDGSDETITRCDSHYCPPFAFRCNYGGCIPGRSRCDGRVDCHDGSDELETLCSNSTKPALDRDRIEFRDEDEEESIPRCTGETIDIKK